MKLKVDDWTVQPTSIEAARGIVEQWHYAHGAANTAVYAHGLFCTGSFLPLGVVWWLPAVRGSVDKYNPGGVSSSLMCHRLAINPMVPSNAASFLLGRSIRLIKQDARFDFLITYADTWRGHSGAIYKATNWEYQGLSVPTPVWVTSEGTQLSRKYGGGGSYTHAQMIARGGVLKGYYAKHVYTMRLKIARSREPQQLSLNLLAV